MLAHHAGEQVLLAVLASGITVVGGVAVVVRASFERVRRWLSLP